MMLRASYIENKFPGVSARRVRGGQDGLVNVPCERPDELVRFHLEDGAGHSLHIAVLKPDRRIRVEVKGPAGVELRGDFELWSFEGQLDLLRSHGTDRSAGIAGRFRVAATEEADRGGSIDWGNGGPTIWLHPNRRGPEIGWCVLPMAEALDDFSTVWAVHQGNA